MSDREEARSFHEYYRANGTLMNQAAADSSIAAIKSLFLLNGGAAIALLALAGQIKVTKTTLLNGQFLVNGIWYFGLGVLSASLCACFAYLTNYSGAGVTLHADYIWNEPYIIEGKNSKIFRILHILFLCIAVLVAILSLAFFGFGLFEAKQFIIGML